MYICLDCSYLVVQAFGMFERWAKPFMNLLGLKGITKEFESNKLGLTMYAVIEAGGVQHRLTR